MVAQLKKKRKLVAASGPAPKRSKGPTSTTARDKRRTKAATVRTVDAASLSWKLVGEDFGGLEVIAGVDVVKDGGRVQFVVKDGNRDKGNTFHGDGCDWGDVAAAQDEEDSFEGFDDDPMEGQDIAPRKAGGSQAGLASDRTLSQAADHAENRTNKKKGKEKKGKDGTRNGQAMGAAADEGLSKPPAHGGNSFAALAEVAQREQQDDDIDLADWVALNVSPRVLSGIAKLGFAKPTTIQRMAIPEIAAGEDVIGKAQTGSGKTLAFGIPIVDKWLEIHEDGRGAGDKTGPTALVLSPTRELAKQLGDHIKALCDGLAAAPYVCVVTGGLSIQKQQRQLAKADIIVGTPGRLWEVMDGDMGLQESLTRIEFLVVDEADRLLRTGQFKEAEDIIGALDRRDPEAAEQGGDGLPPRQTLVFSATFDRDLQTKLAGKGKARARGSAEDRMAYLMNCLRFRREPKFLDANPVSQLADKLREGLIECGAMEKVSRSARLLRGKGRGPLGSRTQTLLTRATPRTSTYTPSWL